MPKCIRIRKKHRKVCIGDMRDRVILQDRDIVEPVFGDPDFDENFTNNNTVWAAINTVSGKTFFDGVNTDINVTHEVYIRYDPTVTAETWIELADGRRLDIINPEDFDERNEFMRLICTDRGNKILEAAKA